jgi:hypothetical protein
VVGIAATPDGNGYWLVGSDGGVFAFGNAGFFGSMGGKPLNAPVVGIAATPDGNGYWLVGSDGGVFAFGNAGFFGSMGGKPLNAPLVGMAPGPGGQGYTLAAGDGGVFAFGSAGFHGSASDKNLNGRVVGIASTPSRAGYWLAAADGGIFAFGDAGFKGSLPALGFTSPTPAAPSAPAPGASADVRGTIVSLAQRQMGIRETGTNCNPFGPCVPWCALFASWIWSHSGIPIGSIPTVRGIYKWSADRGQALPVSARPHPGDAVIYGAAGDQHTGLVELVLSDGSITTIEGNYSDKVSRVGPFLPSQSARYNGMPIYGFASPLSLTTAAAARAATLGVRAAATAPPAKADPADPAALLALVNSQVPPANSPAARALKRRPALQHVPYRRGAIRVTIARRTTGGKVVLAVRYTGSKTSAVRSYRRFLARYHDSGKDYVVRYTRKKR